MKVSLIIPTRNESDNLRVLIPQLKPYGHEIIVVDDSDDDTAEVAESLGATLIRGQRKGLGQAIVDGINASESDVVLVMDADNSHSPSAVSHLLKPILEQGYEFVIGSRYVAGGDFSNWALDRKIKSIIGVKLMKLVTGINDSNSGFFAFKKSIIEGAKLNGKTWKIMLEVLFKGKYIARKEVPITFGDRQFGDSKRSTKQVFKDALNIIRLLIYKFPKRYINFAIVGGIGAISYFIIFWAITTYLNMWYGYSYFIATMIAMTQNYIMNHFITFRHSKEHNKNHIKGFAVYFSGSWSGELVEYGVMLLLTECFGIWYILSDFIGSGFSSVIKYTIFRKKIWGEKKGRTAKSEDYEWHAFYKGLPWQKRWKRLIARVVKEYAERDGGAGEILDLGCGSSPQGLLINHDDYLGIDPSKEKIEYMQSKGLDNCLFIQGTMDTVELQEEYFDTALFIEVIEHLNGIEEAERILAKFHKLLKHDGKLIVATPNFGGFMGRAMDKLYDIFQKNAYAKEHQLKFGLESLKETCFRCGFAFVEGRVLSGADMVCYFQKAN